MSSAPVTILTSAVGLGIYVPALLVQRRLHAMGHAARVEVLEDYYTPSHRESHLAHRKAHHEDFALAQMAHRMARDVQHCMDGERVAALLRGWRSEGRERFIVWSGFWLPVIERYRAIAGGALDVDHCRIDAAMSASFKVHADLQSRGREIRLWNREEGRIVHQIPVTTGAPIDFAARDNRLVVHGGGWGIGTYRSAARELRAASFALDVVVHDPVEASAANPGERCLMLDPAWHPWQRDAEGELGFPPMMDGVGASAAGILRHADHHPLYDVIATARAIVSKPGGCTLIDSLASATPVVFLEAYGSAEQRNAELWTQLGFGIAFAAWRESGYSAAILARLHGNLLAHAGSGIDYPRAYAERLREPQAA